MEVGIVLVGLGAMYILSNQGQQKIGSDIKHYKRKEGFGNHRSNLANPPVNNYPVEEKGSVKTSTLYYSGANNNTEKPQTNMDIGSNLTQPGQVDKFKSLTGESMRPGDIKHNNMQPFFGSSITQSTRGYEGLLDNYTGAGSQNIEKTAQAPMFKPQKDMHWQNGMPSTTEYMQERMRNVVTSKMNNTKPWNEVQVGPGLNKVNGKKGSGGFNSALEARDRWQPKTVDQLRTKNNPKMSYKGQVLGAKGIGERANIGDMEKNRPDTFYIQSADRWLTTTGAGGEKQTSQAEQILRDVNRINQLKEHFGGGANEGQATYQPGHRQPSTRPELAAPIKHISNATVKNGWGASSDSDYGKSGYNSLANARSLTGNNERMGNAFHATLTALAAPITDVLRPTRKQNVVGNARGAGNAKSGVTEKNVIWNPNDRLKTTIKEQTENTHSNKPGGWAIDAGHTTNPHQPVYGQRDTTTCPFVGNPSATESTGAGFPTYNSAYGAQQNYNKEQISKVDRYNIGNTNQLNTHVNLTTYSNKMSAPGVMRPNMPKSSSSMSVIGKYSNRNVRETSQSGRQSGDLLAPFAKNPYTHSLTNAV
jgi:hypothetical protein